MSIFCWRKGIHVYPSPKSSWAIWWETRKQPRAQRFSSRCLPVLGTGLKGEGSHPSCLPALSLHLCSCWWFFRKAVNPRLCYWVYVFGHSKDEERGCIRPEWSLTHCAERLALPTDKGRTQSRTGSYYTHMPMCLWQRTFFFFFILKRNEWKIVWECETNRSITSCVCVYEFFFLDSIW